MTRLPLTGRTCGICPVSHQIASSKACDALLAVSIPPTAVKLRRIINLAQVIQSHALSFFHLSSPDFLFGMDGDPQKRNIIGVATERPELARDGIALRKFGQEIISGLGGKRIHPTWVVPGGVSAPLESKMRDEMLAAIPAAHTIILRSMAWFKGVVDKFRDEIGSFARFSAHGGVFP